MNQVRRQIECLNKLQSLNGGISDIFEFLYSETLLTREQIHFIKSCPDVGKVMQVRLAAMCKEGKIQLLEYEWNILPIERIKITIVTDKSSKEFEFGL
jgi:hypothetical protein